jgi:hypothetical protein
MKLDINTLTEIGGVQILEFVRLTSEQKRTGDTKHIIGGQEQSVFFGLSQFANLKGKTQNLKVTGKRNNHGS